MNSEAFAAYIKQACPIGSFIDTPKGEASMITGYSRSHILYSRNNVTISVAFLDLYKAYSHFYGQSVSTTELREFMPEVFDSKVRKAKYACNCILLFRLLEKLRLSGPITGTGAPRNPYSVKISMRDTLHKNPSKEFRT